MSTQRGKMLDTSNKGILDVDFNSFSCLLMRKSCLQQVIFDGVANYDVLYCKELQHKGYIQRLDSSILCTHGPL